MNIRKEKNPLQREELNLLSEIQQAKWDLDMAYSNFENVVDPDLIDCCIYELKAVQMRYKFLLTKAKECNLTQQ